MMLLLRKPFHVSWMIALSCLGIVIGVIFAPILHWSWITELAWLLIGITFVMMSCAYQRVAWVITALLGGLIIGLWRGTIAENAYVLYEPLIGNMVTITRIVSEDSDTDKNGNVVVRLKEVEYNNTKLPGMIWVSLDVKKADVQRSDKVKVNSKVNEGFGTFGASMYRAKLMNVQRPVPGDIALYVRNWFADAIRTAIPEPESSLGIGYLVGQRRGLPEELDAALKTAGLTHIVVASGYNLTILVRFARRYFAKISKYLAALVSGGLIASFIAVTGLSPSMSRAGLVTGLSLLAWYYGRKIHPLVLLALAAAVTILFNPSYGWGDIGWQLSFMAFAGVMLLAPLMQRFYFGEKKPGVFRQILGETIAATIMTLPIILTSFGVMSNVAVIANLLILPLVPLAMLLTFIAGVGAILLPGAALIIGFAGYTILNYMTQVAHFLAGLSWATTEVEFTLFAAVATYSAIAVWMLYMNWRTRIDLREVNIVE
jgi:competence protein ComEC